MTRQGTKKPPKTRRRRSSDDDAPEPSVLRLIGGVVGDRSSSEPIDPVKEAVIEQVGKYLRSFSTTSLVRVLGILAEHAGASKSRVPPPPMGDKA